MYHSGYKFSSVLLLILILFYLSILFGGCGTANALLLETKVNDPIMMNLLDNDLDIAQIEDGTGFIGEATACPT